MSKFQSLHNILSNVPKKVLAVFGVIVMSAAIAIPFLTNAYGPTDRATFTMNKPADYVTFNSITDNPDNGDERNFVKARVDDGKNATDVKWNSNEITVERGKEYIVSMFVHNNAAANLNLVAQNVRAKANVPTNTAKEISIDGFISADNAIYKTKNGDIIKDAVGNVQRTIWDSVVFKSNENFNLAVNMDFGIYYQNNSVGKTGNGVKISNDLLTSQGALLGYDKLDGKIPGCMWYSGYVVFKVKPQFADTISIGVNKQVSKQGKNDWQETVTVGSGEIVDFQIKYANRGTINQFDVDFRDILPEGVTYVANSAYAKWSGTVKDEYKDNDYFAPITVNAENLFTTGIQAIHGPNAWAGPLSDLSKSNYIVKFSAKMPVLPCETTRTLQNIARISATANGQRYFNEDTASVIVVNNDECPKVEKCPIPGKEDLDKDDPNCKEDEIVEPEYICKLLTADRITIRRGEKVNFTVTPQMKGDVRVKEYTMDFGDNSTFTGTSSKFAHQFAKVGIYTAKASITFDVEGKTVAGITSAQCAKTIKVTDEKTPPVTPPKELPKTGGELGAAAGLGSAATAAAYYVASRRKLNQ